MSSSIAELLALAGDPDSELRRDAQVLLCHVLQQPRSYLYTWPEKRPDAALAADYQAMLQARRTGTPVAYLTGSREFWSLPLAVSPHTLIPRPETELLVERALAASVPAQARVLDLGTGSGAIALALARERPAWQIAATDMSEQALDVARQNAARLHVASVRWLPGSWFAAVAGERFDLVVSNPPYLDEEDPHLQRGDLRFEPRAALVAEGGALGAIEAIVDGAPAHLAADGWLLLEHGCEQGATAAQRLRERGFTEVQTWRDDADLPRVSGGRWRDGDRQ